MSVCKDKRILMMYLIFESCAAWESGQNWGSDVEVFEILHRD